MTRRRLGSHGQICERKDGRMRMTIRPEPRAYAAWEIAERIGSYIEVLYNPHSCYSDPEDDISYREAMEKIRAEKMTQKWVINKLNDIWYMANYEEGTDSIVSIDVEEYESHQAMLDWVHMTFPKFNKEE